MNPYPHGQCTWGAAEMCSCLQNLSKYGNFGNGGDWFAHAKSIGLETTPNAKVGWLASFSVSGWPDGPGDVGLIVAVNPTNNTVIRYGVNWHLDGTWSTDVVPANYVIGSFKPPCDCVGSGGQIYNKDPNQPQGSSGCVTWKWHFDLPAGQAIDLCFDNVIGMVATAGGMLLIATGLIVMMIGAGMEIKARSQQQAEQKPQEEQLPSSEQVQTMTPEQRDQIIMKARARAAARRAKYLQTRGYKERRVATLKTTGELAPGGRV